MPEARNKDELDKLLEDAGISKGSTTIQTSCELTDTELVITKGKTGIGPDMDALKEAILKAISIEDYEAVIECPTMKTPPEELDLEAYYEKTYIQMPQMLLWGKIMKLFRQLPEFHLM